MRTQWRWLFVALLVGAGRGHAEDFKGVCNIRFSATSTLHDFAGHVLSEPFVATLTDTDNRIEALGAAEVGVMVEKMDAHKHGINKNMFKMFDADNYPLIVSTLKDAQPYALIDQLRVSGEEGGQVEFDLKIRDITRPVIAALTNLKEDEKTISLDMQFPVSLATYQLKPASLMGLLKVGDTVTVSVTVTLQKPTAKTYLGG